MDKEFITINEAAIRFSISRTTIYALIREGVITKYKIGRAARIDPVELSTYIRRGAVSV